MIFMHTHFIRGDKKKCLAIRSIVKKPPASASAASTRGKSVPSVRLQRYGDAAPSGVVPAPGEVIANELLRSNHQAMYGHGASMLSSLGSAYNMLGAANLGGLPTMNHGLGTLLPQPNFFNSGFDLMQPQRYLMGLDNTSSGLGQGQGSSAAAAAAAALHINHSYSGVSGSQQMSAAGISSSINSLPPDSIEEVNLASKIMNDNPTVDAWQALQMAKRRLNETRSSTGGHRRQK